MSLIDDIWNGIWGLTFGTDLEGLQGVFDFLLAFVPELLNMLYGTFYLLAYPVISIITSFYNFAAYLWLNVATFLNIFISVPNTAWFVVENSIGQYMPPVWIWILFLMLSLRVIFIIIKRVDKITIAGFSI